MEHWSEYTRFVTALFLILNPFAALPIFLVLAKTYTDAERNRIINIAAFTVMLILVASAITGEALLHAMGTSLDSFRVGGGIVILLMALAMLRGQVDNVRTSPTEEAEAEDKHSIAVVPLAIPLLAGPGSISNVIIQMHRSETEYHALLVIASIMFVCLLLWLVLRMANRIGKILGKIGLNIINRLFGLILAAIAVEIMANGLKQLFPALA
ncbi:MAG: NAAT family transporter [Gammaproteobacteria bacterium]|nr:NAAT family transporter [Gammaproteobacteria bacterium]MCW8986556.1 NAAT family transporter [Gammaproteobacteria bacterium]MCW9031921.1 NAAT family transporter [Gammaproteobacteria bacterium]